MKIAVIGSKGLPPKQGGIEHYCAEVYPRIAAKGHVIDLFGRSSYTDLSWNENANHSNYFNGVRVISLPGTSIRGIDALVNSGLASTVASLKEYDIVHFHALGPSLFSLLPKLASKAKIVVTCHGLDWQRAKWGNLSSRVILHGERNAVRYADEILVVSNALQDYFLKTYNRQTIYLPNAPATYADSDPKFSYAKSLGLSKGKYIAYLGRLVPEKCPDLLINAFTLSQEKDWKLVLIGGMSDTAAYSKELTKLADKNPNVLLLGELRGEFLAEIMRGSGLFVLPSKLEGLPLAMLEAMSEGIPIVASDIPPHTQLLGQDRGVLFQSGNLAACIQSIKWAMNHPREMEVMARNAKKFVNMNYNWDAISNKLTDLYCYLLDDHFTSTKGDTGIASVKK